MRALKAGLFVVGLFALGWTVAEFYSAKSWVRLFQEPSEYNGQVIVMGNGQGLRVMQHSLDETVLQTVMNPAEPLKLYSPYSRLAFAGLGMREAPTKSFLLVGLGGGATPAFIREAIPGARVDVVDIDPVVLKAAQLHFGFREGEGVRAHIVDGRAFVEAAPAGAYDFVLLDAYSGSDVPKHLRTFEFLQELRRTLSPGGVVASNIMGPEINAHYVEMLDTLAAAFPEGVLVVKVPERESRVVFALTQRIDGDGEAIGMRAASAARRIGLPEDVGVFPEGMSVHWHELNRARAQVAYDGA